MKDAGVIPARHDRGVSEAAAATGEKVLLQVGAHLGLVLTGLHQGADALMGFGADLAGLTQSVQFSCVLAQAHRMQDWARRRELPHRFAGAGRAIELIGPAPQHQLFHFGVTPHPKTDPLSPLEVVGKQRFELL